MEISPEAGKPWYPVGDVLKVALGNKWFEVHHTLIIEDPTGILALYIPQVTQAIHCAEQQIAALGQARAQKIAQDIFGSPKV